MRHFCLVVNCNSVSQIEKVLEGEKSVARAINLKTLCKKKISRLASLLGHFCLGGKCSSVPQTEEVLEEEKSVAVIKTYS